MVQNLYSSDFGTSSDKEEYKDMPKEVVDELMAAPSKKSPSWSLLSGTTPTGAANT